MDVSLQVWSDSIDPVVEACRLFRRAGNDQGGPGLINKDAVYFVYYDIVKFPLDHVLQRVFHVVSEVVKSKLIVGAIGHIGPICCLALCILKPMDYQPYIQTKKAVYLPHPL